MKKLVIFDLGETIIEYKGISLNWKKHYKKAISYALERFNIIPKEEDIIFAESILTFYNTRENYREFEINESEVLKNVSKIFNLDSNLFEVYFFKYFQRTVVQKTDSEQLLIELKNNNLTTAIFTDVPYAMPKKLVLSDIGILRKYFDIIVSSCDAGVRKPHKRALLEICRKFNISPKDTIYIGNEEKDIKCALNADIESILITNNNKEFGQTYTVSNLLDTLKYIIS